MDWHLCVRRAGPRNNAARAVLLALACSLPAISWAQITTSNAATKDLSELARRFSNQRVDRSVMSQGDVLIFVSFSMPDLSLKALAEQAQRTGAILVLRGLHENSMQKTIDRVLEINGGKKAAWQIDPRLYEAF